MKEKGLCVFLRQKLSYSSNKLKDRSTVGFSSDFGVVLNNLENVFYIPLQITWTQLLEAVAVLPSSCGLSDQGVAQPGTPNAQQGTKPSRGEAPTLPQLPTPSKCIRHF